MSDGNAVLVLVDHAEGRLVAASRAAVAAAAQLGGTVDALVAGDAEGAAAAAASRLAGVSRVLRADDAVFAHALAEPLAALLVDLAPGYTHLVAPATAVGKNVMPRVAALLDVQPISEVIAIEDASTFVRPIYAGNALATVRSSDRIKVMTVRAAAFDAAPDRPDGKGADGEGADGGGAAPVETVSAPAAATATAGASRFVGAELSQSERPDLAAARVVVSGGRGMGSGENFRLLDPIADRLGAAIGASRAAVDSGYVPNDHQVGQTGKIIAPDLYVAVGISGAIQHLAGMKDSKIIVAINKDTDAPIFQVADYGLVADLFTAIPELDAALAT